MIRNLLFFLPLLLFVSVNAQTCLGEIPNNATSVDGIFIFGEAMPNQSFWICGDAEAEIDLSNQANYFVDHSASLNLNGDENIIYINGMASVVLNGNNNTVFLGPQTSLTLNGTDNSINAHPDASLELTGDNQSGSCSNVTFDYQSAPSGPCTLFDAIDDAAFFNALRFTQSQNQLTIQNPYDQCELVLVDMSGKIVYSALLQTGYSQHEVSGLSPGILIVGIRYEAQFYSQKYYHH